VSSWRAQTQDELSGRHGRGREVGTITELDPEAAEFREFGAGSRIEFPQLLLQNTDWISLGPGTLVGPFAVLSVGMIEGQGGLDTGPRGANRSSPSANGAGSAGISSSSRIFTSRSTT
jgi:hypothetical protein